MKLIAQWLLFSCGLLLGTAVMGQSVVIKSNLTPPYSPYFADYENHIILTLTNKTNQVQNVKLTGMLENQETGMYVRTKQNYQPLQPIVLQPNQVKTLFANQSSQGFLNKNQVETNASDADKVAILAAGQLPEGIYNFCVTALDFQTSAPLSDPLGGCQIIPINFLDPPTLMSPICDEDNLTNPFPNFSWLPPVGNVGNAALRYKFYLVKLQNGMDANTAIQFAVSSNTGQGLLTMPNLLTTNYLYKPSDPPLVDNATYAWAVRVTDLNGQASFKNNGVSPVCTFTYKFPVKKKSAPVANAVAGVCADACLIDIAAYQASSSLTLPAVNSKVQIGDFEMKITTVYLEDGQSFSGTGFITAPFLNFGNVTVKVVFETMTLSTTTNPQGLKVVLSGSAKGAVDPNGASLLPTFGGPNLSNITSTPKQLSDLSGYIKNKVATLNQLLDPNLFFQMPIGYSNNGYTLAVSQMNFLPTNATFDAIAVLPMPNFTNEITALGFGAGSVCMNKAAPCNLGKLFLTQDFDIDVDGSAAGKELSFVHGTPAMNDNTGTYLKLKPGTGLINGGVESFNIEAKYKFPMATLARADGQAIPVIATMKANATGVFDWILKVQMDNFLLTGNNDFVFKPSPTDMFFDLSDTKNPVLPNIGPYKSGLVDNTWKGFYAPKIAVEFAKGLSNKATEIQVTDLIIDKTGITTGIAALHIITLDKGQVGAFDISLDTIAVQIIQNGFVSGRLAGQIKLPITEGGSANLMDYSAVLSYASPAAKLSYNFNVKLKKDLVVPLWKFNLTVDNTSLIEVTNKNGSFEASANLNGSFGINVSQLLGVGKIDFAGIVFQDMFIGSKAPFVNMGNISTTFASPQKSIGGFPVTLKKMTFVSKKDDQNRDLFGFQFDLNLSLADSKGALPDAETVFSLYGRLDQTNGKYTPVFAEAALDKICVKGNLSVLTIDGCITFFDNDPVYGDGFKGEVKITMPPSLTISATVMFGGVTANNKHFNYWYFDALLILGEGQGIPLFAGIDAFGFGGGAYYHMKKTKDANALNPQGTTVAYDPANMTPSGVKYVPDASMAFGLKAKLFVGLTKREVFNGSVAFEITIDAAGGVDSIGFRGDAQFISNSEMTSGAITGKMIASFSFSQKIFFTEASLDLDFGVIIKAHGSFEMYFKTAQKPTQWYIRFGRPAPNGAPISLEVAGFLKFKSYFEVGNFQIDPMPPPPDFIVDLVKSPSDLTAQAESASDRSGFGNVPGSVSVIHGASLYAHIKAVFLIFYAELEAGIGYDLQLAKVLPCPGYPHPGLGGWYAVGQAYAGLRGDIGIEIDMFGISGKFSVAEVGAAALLQAGFVNPVWAEGKLGGHYSLFDGAISGEIHLEFAVGDKCEPPVVDVLKGLRVLGDISPKTGSIKEEVTTTPSVSVNIPMHKYAEIHLKQPVASINNVKQPAKHRLFRFYDEMVKVAFTKNGVNFPESNFKRVVSEDGNGLMFQPNATLDKLTPYTFKVTVNVEECTTVSYDSASKLATCAGGQYGWALAKLDGKTWKEDSSTAFKTNQGLKAISEDMVEFTFPYKQQASFLYKENEDGKAKIKLTQGFNINSYDFPVGVEAKLEARFIPFGNAGAVHTIPLPTPQGQKLISFDYPATLAQNAYYSIQLLINWKHVAPPVPNQKEKNFTAQNTQSSKMYLGDQYVVVKTQQLTVTKLNLPAEAIKLYEIRFRTSMYANVAEKTAALKLIAATYLVRKQGTLTHVPVTLTGNELTSSATIVNAINAKVHNPVQAVPMIWTTTDQLLTGYERFDNYDIYGYQKKAITHAPLLSYDVPEMNDFSQALETKILGILFEDKAALHVQSWNKDVLGGSWEAHIAAPKVDTLIGWDEGLNPLSHKTGFNNPTRAGNIGLIYEPVVLHLYLTMKGGDVIPILINPNVTLADMVGNWVWSPINPLDTHAKYLERVSKAWDAIGLAYNSRTTQVGTPPKIGVRTQTHN